MNQYLSNYSIISLYSLIQDQRSYVTALSLIKNKVYLSDSQNEFQNTLFYIQLDGNNMDFSIPIEYDQPIYLRHKISRKYLSLIIDQDEEKDIKYKIVLASEKQHFKITPCYQYQVKVSTRIKFNEEVMLMTEYDFSREGKVVIEGKELYLGFTGGSKLHFHLYSIYQKEEKANKHGRIVWLSHIQSDNFLSIVGNNGKQQAVFQSIHYDKQIQNLKALWIINSSRDPTASRDIQFDEQLHLRNLYNRQYLCFSKNYKLVDNERIYSIYLDDQPSEFTRFVFKPVKDDDRKEVHLSAYMSVLHAESGLYLGCRKEKTGDFFKLLTFPMMDDEDLFKVNSFSEEEEQALRFIFIIRREFQDISVFIQESVTGIVSSQMRDILQTYENVLIEMLSLKKSDKLYEFVRNQLGSSIKFIAQNLSYFRSIVAPNAYSNQRIKKQALKIIRISYKILCLFCQNHQANQKICHQYIKHYITDIGTDMGVQQLLIETFRNNKQLLPKIKQSPQQQLPNLVRSVLLQFSSKNIEKRVQQYWLRLKKILDMLNTFIFYRRTPFDINQDLISYQLFTNGFYEQIFLPLRVKGERILINYIGREETIEDIKDPLIFNFIVATFDLFSNLACNHSVKSKLRLHQYLSQYNIACLTTLILYLNRSLRKELYSTLLNFTAKCFVDSAPRIKRKKPMSFIFFSNDEQKTSVQQQQAYYSERLRQMLMLKAQQSRICKPLHYSNTITIGGIQQPTMAEEQLVSFRLNLTEKILNSASCSLQQLETVSLLIRLECYTVNQVLQIYQEFRAKLLAEEIPRILVPKMLQFFQQLFFTVKQLQIKKMIMFIKHKFLQKQQLKPSQYKYIFPFSPRLPSPAITKTVKQQASPLIPQHENTQRQMMGGQFRDNYNELRDTLLLMHASPQLKKSFMDYFCKFNEKEMNNQVCCEYLSSIFIQLLYAYLPNYRFLRLVSRCSILTHEEIQQFERLFHVAKKMQYLTMVSDNWLVQDGFPECVTLFLDCLREVTGFFFQQGTPRGKWSVQTVLTKQQLLVGNLGIHNSVFQLLQKNIYLLNTSKKLLKKKHKQIFQSCFLLIYWLIKQCSQNKKIIYEYISIIQTSLQYLQIGQAKVFMQFYRDQKPYVKQIGFNTIQSFFMRIIKRTSNEKKYDECQYNPNYLGIIITFIESLDMEAKFLIEKLHKFIVRSDVFHRLLFLQPPNQDQVQVFSLKLLRIRLDPIQIPIFYHIKLLKLFRLIFQNGSQTIRNSLKLKIVQQFDIQYLLSLLSTPDIFSVSGIAPQLNFILKQQMTYFIIVLLQKSDLYAKLYESEALKNLLEYYSLIFLKQIDRKQTTTESQSLFIPYLEDYLDSISLYQGNKGLYYLEHVEPLINRFVTIFQKQPARMGRHKLKDYLITLAQSLKQSFAGISVKRATTLGQRGLKDIKLKWRNFVDDDEDNSAEQKYAKKTILDILKSSEAKDQIDEQLKRFYETIDKRAKQFIKSMIKLLTLLFANRDISDGRKREGKIAQEAIKYFSGYIKESGENKQAQIVKLLKEQGFLQVLLQLTSQKQFQLTKVHLKNIFFHCLRILNFLLVRDNDFRTSKKLLQSFNKNHHANRFLLFLKEGALQVIASVDSHHYYQQMNSALLEMRLCADEPLQYLFEESFLTLTLLCKYQPFTAFLRKQQSSFSDVDFLEKIFSMLSFLFHSSKTVGKAISISSVHAGEYILDFVCSMLTGMSKSNQTFIIDNKYSRFVHDILKLQKLQQLPRNYQRQQLKNKVVDFYHSNGIDITQLLDSKIRLIDYRDPYLLNRFKYVLLKTLLECLIGNPANEAKVKMELPIEIVKLNLIWVYESYKSSGSIYTEQMVMRQRSDWITSLEKINKIKQSALDPATEQIKGELFLRLGFYYFQLIQVALFIIQMYYSKREGEGETNSGEQKIINEQKQKQRVVRRFFTSIQDNQQSKQSLKLLQGQSLGDQMHQCYDIYYQALQFFQSHIQTVEVNMKSQIIRYYFPKLPLSDSITDQMMHNFKQNASRISRQQKIKSLMEWQINFYEDLKGEQEFFNQMDASMPILSKLLRLLKYQDEFLFIAWLNSLLICILFLIENYYEPGYDLVGQFFFYISPVKPLHSLMLFLSIISVSSGLFISFYMFLRKIPLSKKLFRLKYVKLKEEGQIEESQIAYVWPRVLKETIYTFYIVGFLLLTIFHPFFSVFILIQIIRRIQLGRFIIRSLKQTWQQLSVTVALLMVFNIIYAQLAYQFFTSAITYGPLCETQASCLLMYSDQNLKAGQGVFGVAKANWIDMGLNMQVLYEIFYIILSLKLIFQIFSGTIIDKFSELRENQQAIQQDQNNTCFICAQQRFDLDLEYQGFDVHVEKNHNPINYIDFLFYLRNCHSREHGIIQRFVSDCKERQSQQWIPEGDSYEKQLKTKEEEVDDEDVKDKMIKFCKDTYGGCRKMHQKVEVILRDIKHKDQKAVKNANDRQNQ